MAPLDPPELRIELDSLPASARIDRTSSHATYSHRRRDRPLPAPTVNQYEQTPCRQPLGPRPRGCSWPARRHRGHGRCYTAVDSVLCTQSKRSALYRTPAHNRGNGDGRRRASEDRGRSIKKAKVADRYCALNFARTCLSAAEVPRTAGPESASSSKKLRDLPRRTGATIGDDDDGGLRQTSSCRRVIALAAREAADGRHADGHLHSGGARHCRACVRV